MNKLFYLEDIRQQNSHIIILAQSLIEARYLYFLVRWPEYEPTEEDFDCIQVHSISELDESKLIMYTEG